MVLDFLKDFEIFRFRFKYHPTDSIIFKEEHKECIQKRLNIFNSLVENGRINSTKLDYTNAENIIRLMDTSTFIIF